MSGACICAIAKNEHLYLDEWITYHISLGFKHIFIYDNHDTPTIDRMFGHKYKSSITIIHWPGHAAQYPAYNHFIKQDYSTQYKWVSFHDIDEFLVIKTTQFQSLEDLLEKHCPNGSLSFNWLMFGSSGLTSYTPQPVTKRFQRCEKMVDQHVKSISVITDIDHIVNAHYVVLKSGGVQRDTNGKQFFGPWNPNGPNDIAQINHYWCKSKGEYSLRYGKHVGDGLVKLNKIEEMEKTNEGFDSSAWDFYKKYEIVKDTLL